MGSLRAVGLLLLLLGVSSASTAGLTCPYCTCSYNAGRWFLHHLKTPVHDDIQCVDWCKEHQPIHYTHYSECNWDGPSKTCYSGCAGCATDSGCYQTKFSTCPSHKTQEACNNADGGPKSCSCALNGAYDSCSMCGKCQCDYSMGSITLNASTTPTPILATPEICAKRCQQYGDGMGSGWWARCVGRCECRVGECSTGCHRINDTCTPGPNHESCHGMTECSCPLLGSGVHPGCPTRNHPPVAPSSLFEEGEKGEDLGIRLQEDLHPDLENEDVVRIASPEHGKKCPG